MVARGLHENRYGTGHDDGMQHRLVAVSIDHHHIPWGYRVVPDDFVRGTRSVGDKKAMIRIENTRCIAFTLANRTIMVEQLT